MRTAKSVYARTAIRYGKTKSAAGQHHGRPQLQSNTLRLTPARCLYETSRQEPALKSPEIEVLYEDNHLLVINKPAELATMGALAGEPTAAAWAADYLKQRYQKPGNVFVGVVSRLDSFVSGVLVLARTSKAASRLTEQFRDRKTEKLYIACVEGVVDAPEWKTISTHVAKNDSAHRMVVVPPTARDAQLASLQFRSLCSSHNRTLVEVNLLTGRKHQIRLQLSSEGYPIVGDAKYGSTLKFPKGISLHSRRLTIEHPTQRTLMTFEAAPPQSWNSHPAELQSYWR